MTVRQMRCYIKTTHFFDAAVKSGRGWQTLVSRACYIFPRLPLRSQTGQAVLTHFDAIVSQKNVLTFKQPQRVLDAVQLPWVVSAFRRDEERLRCVPCNHPSTTSLR